ncbi:hypothetical protein QM012_008504 [Aureobasidium pullulans]|uniref:Uncharacterized protein n=1 Tax=Aureobasidium pullulans TaxID=5580 RepID=A0ABR0TKG8_AURPU
MPERHHDQDTLLLLLIALINPVIAVFMMRGCGLEVVICFLLCLLFIFPGSIYAFYLVAEHARKKKLDVTGYPAQSTKSNAVQVVPTSPPPVVQAIEFKPQPAAPPPPTPVSPTPAAPTPAPAVAEQVVVVTKSPDKASEKASEAPPVVVSVAAAK